MSNGSFRTKNKGKEITKLSETFSALRHTSYQTERTHEMHNKVDAQTHSKSFHITVTIQNTEQQREDSINFKQKGYRSFHRGEESEGKVLKIRTASDFI